MNHNFPFEILKMIAQHLGTLDHIECALVNKTWTIIFTYALYKTVLIRTQRQFKLFYRTLLQTTLQSHEPGGLIKYLKIEYKVGFTDQDFNFIIECCPALRTISFNPKLWRYLHSPSKLNTLKYIEKLPMLNEKRHAGPLIKEHGH
ncbi:hypothetical protein BDF14DRAFT_1884899 [Spinellus fusiger]|nr:hypothetical protein BDF14DRAFT_1884899 [Spinellus fusiger]